VAFESRKDKILAYNRAVHEYEDKKYKDLSSEIDILQSLDPVAVKDHADNLRANLQGVMQARTQDELAMYKQSFESTLGELIIHEDVLEIFKSITSLRLVIDLAHTSFEDDLKTEKNIRDFRRNTRLNYIDLILEQFYANAVDLQKVMVAKQAELRASMNSADELASLEYGIKKIATLMQAFQLAREHAKNMLDADTLDQFNQMKQLLVDQLSTIREAGGAKEGGKELQNKVAGICQTHLDHLCAARASYLPGDDESLPRLINFGWIGVGAAIVVVAAIFTAPVAALVLGIAGIVYGAIDLIKHASHPIAKQVMPTLGKRHIEKPEMTTREKAASFAKKALPIVVSILALAGAAAVLAFPVAGIPLAVVGAVLAIATGAIYARKVYKAYQARQTALAQHKITQANFIATKDRVAFQQVGKLSKVEVSIRSIAPHSTDAKMKIFLQSHKEAVKPVSVPFQAPSSKGLPSREALSANNRELNALMQHGQNAEKNLSGPNKKPLKEDDDEHNKPQR
jgi:hypothetical protein